MGLSAYYDNYIIVLIFLILGILLPVVALTFGRFVRPKNPYAEKVTTYESGIQPKGDAQVRYHVAYYLVALEFIIFDVETVFLFPWAVALDQLGWYGLNIMLIFLTILVLGLAYSWKKRVLEWN
ncbi:NADH-quinone oxidoreductase subunit A [Salisediminibacterium halotolerans]|uniref:NADH-quinone oxidoreductase subunit A n=1 Tax=Salisediminibacterium halotolerans TaxID=517425 RepID=A0A1H9QP95_9BACI|nr:MULTISPECIES: NADH-quinone oxidoreductase subunit A [Salisediminibacterium]RLJ75793.1 NADH dehydrogenase subunit A [Actinophytocola xinjiangensis]RPE89647.1 NADH dehydrogenase subunit A [Salisediminibacterium halotolerans]TWG36406.1 NADH dehydrogenase subunit A [Salisediminibacterium halotolerans]SER62326.1 NADH-quinone oxidoreductase subunit A [Salisediminibacterium haloalkalitolerans]GEL07516.1 NADH-quinone oxidoreductase subunit A [Salisediminibacterium halotolerans]